MKRGVTFFVVAAATAAAVADRALATWRGPGIRAVETSIVIDERVERTWAVLADVPRQPEWMAEMKRVRMTTPAPIGEGSRGEATVRILGISTHDPVEIAVFDPPHRFAVRHLGPFTGVGVIDLDPVAGGQGTLVRWSETLVAPILPHLFTVLGGPVLRRVFQADLVRLKRIVEAG